MTCKQFRQIVGFMCDKFEVVYKTNDGTEIKIKSAQVDFDGEKVILRKE